MKWLQKLAEQGLIREEVYQNIMNDCSTIKTSGLNISAENVANHLLNATVGAAAFIGVNLGISGAVGLAKKIVGKTPENNIVRHIQENARAIVSMPEFAKDQQKALDRYRELCSISVNAAMNLPLAKAMVHKNLYSGFSNDDVIRLSTIQSQTSTQGAHVSESLAHKIRPHVMGKIAADCYLLQKQAGDLKGTLGTMAAITGASLLMGGIGAGIGAIADKIKGNNLQENLKKSFNNAVGKSELLAAKHEEARDAFKTLVHFAPHVALEPKAARSFMEKLVAYGDAGGHVDISDIKALSDIHKSYAASKKPSMASQNFRHMYGASGGDEGLKGINRNLAEELAE